MQTHRKLHFQLFEQPLPTMNDGFSHPIMARDVCVGKGVAEDHTHMVEFRAFDNTNRLKTCERKEERKVLGLT